jgi:hypothetical protein
VATAWRYGREAITLLAATADDLKAAMRTLPATSSGPRQPRPARRGAARRGAAHELTAARTHGIIDALTGH